MKKFAFLAFFLFFTLSFFSLSFVSAEKNLTYFYGNGCSHCANVVASGILEKVASNPEVRLSKLEVTTSQTNRDLFNKYMDDFGIHVNNRGYPFLVIECNDSKNYLFGDKPIINELENKIEKCDNSQINNTKPINKDITLPSVVIAAIVDSINPCAFGVLVFLMLSLLKIGSSKRALKAGILYTCVVFLVYFLSGLGIFKVIQSFSSLSHYIYLGAGLLVLIAGLIEIKDFFWYGKGISLKIPSSAKPTIEKFIAKGTLPAIMILGVLVSLFELPCTGGIYLAILTMMSQNNSFSFFYLFIYNLVFVLPLIIITLIIYKGINPERVQNWTNKEKKWMRLATGLVMLALALYILWPYIF